MLLFRSCMECGQNFTTHYVPWFDDAALVANLCEDCRKGEKTTMIITSCPKCGADVYTTERDLAEGSEFLCDNCEDTLPGMYELVQAERRSMDADPDWQERHGPYISEFSVAASDTDEILITDVDGSDLWQFTANQIDLLLIELEVMLVYIRDGVTPDKRDVEKAFDEIKTMRRRRVNAA